MFWPNTSQYKNTGHRGLNWRKNLKGTPDRHHIFTIHHPDLDFEDRPEIVLQYDPVARTGFNRDEIRTEVTGYPTVASDPRKLAWAVLFLQVAIHRMTGSELPFVSRKNISRGIVLTLLAAIPRSDRHRTMRMALEADPDDHYSNGEVYYCCQKNQWPNTEFFPWRITGITLYTEFQPPGAPRLRRSSPIMQLFTMPGSGHLPPKWIFTLGNLGWLITSLAKCCGTLR